MWKILFLCFLVCYLHFGFSQDLCGHSGRFPCGDGSCISRAKVCDGVEDCHRQTDEARCTNNIPCRRNLTMAVLNSYTSCRKPCTTSSQCRGLKQCVCDDECGNTCVNPNVQCKKNPPNITNAFEMVVKRVRSGTSGDRLRPTPAPYIFGDVATYSCSRGYKFNGPFPRCNGRGQWSNEMPKCVDITCRGDVPTVNNTTGYNILRTKGQTIVKYDPNDSGPEIGDKIEYICGNGLQLEGSLPSCGEDLQWSDHTAVCAAACDYERNEQLISRYRVRCGKECTRSSDCSNGQECVCAAVCSRVCVDPEAECPTIPTVENANVTYNGTGMNKVARYQCMEGYYLDSGGLTLRCSSAGTWIGTPPVCSRVHCGSPYNSIEQTGGLIFNDGGTEYGSIVSFHCGSNKKMYGSKLRRCKEDGLWSGKLTVCDNDHEDRCHHPGIPINGRLLGRNFSVDAIVRFECNPDYVLYGRNEQTCLVNGWGEKEWSGGGAPACKHYKHSQGGNDVVGLFARAISQLPKSYQSLGRSININNDNFDIHDVYFVIDVSESVVSRPDELKEEIAFAKRLVERMKIFGKSVYYGLMIFASHPRLIIPLTDEVSTHKKVIKELDGVYREAKKNRKSRYYNRIKSGTATYAALEELKQDIANSRAPAGEASRPRKTHVFLFTDGQHNEGPDPRGLKKEFKHEFQETIEFYSITACCKIGEDHPAKAIQELKDLTFEKEHNFIRINDYYQLSKLLDKVTNVTIDYSRCGRAGDVGRAQGQTVSLGRSVGGNIASEDAWPWHVVISNRQGGYNFDGVLNTLYSGSGSILSNRWILTAAHIINFDEPTDYAVFAGAFKRSFKSRLPSSIKGFEIVNYFPHPEFDHDSYNNDIALIKIGNEFDKSMNLKSGPPGLTFGYYVRPVCLPCTGAYQLEAVVKELETNVGSTTVDQCGIEETSLREPGSKTIATGFGHTNIEKKLKYKRLNLSVSLRQVLLRIADNRTCAEGIERITRKKPRFPLLYNVNNICTEPKINDSVTDACKGDSGGPMLREIKLTPTKSRWVQIGIVSFGYGCGTGIYPGYFTNVAKYISWINQTTEGAVTGH